MKRNLFNVFRNPRDSHNVNSRYKDSCHKDSANLANLTNPRANPSYKNYIALAFVLTAIYGAIYAIMRVCMVRDNINGANLLSCDFTQMFIMGARLDLRAICVFAALVVILGYVANAIWRVNIANRTHGGGELL